ncbi:Vitamin B12 import ATP-binding protein BtuD [Paenibacillus allorhizoplanae]|uniref:Vitamin B12 import ATP-binding protein BtuD n=1 Tax=Paenibacillus allorhizoplanae TaxID=2905648 RepID=A0ABN8GGL9_9BACL|nr:ABC transporter ATP-binding protein [Paenibacillus allorhizoplanae]CAH1208528.1 Vitamin B12 import ATP-binding protein BtuD [Paenibacillus allorhizoplanae]
MNSNIAIEVRNVSKKYKIYQDKPVSLKERILYTSKSTYQEKWVLQEVNLSVLKGKMIGLIGRNGSGKSTLLKILTRILKPDKGEVVIHGRVSSLLELGAGFHMDFTGRENVYMNASIFGLTRKEIDSLLDTIVKFSELEAYIDNPVRTYSSGMFMRLAFSIAIHVEPDVLLIDEILAVGDNAFQKKCISKIEEFKQKGKTIVFVSHDNGAMERLCDELYWIHESKIRQNGKPDEVIREYLDFLANSEENRMKIEAENQKEENTNLDKDKDQANQLEKRWGTGAVEISKVLMVNPTSENLHVLEKGQPIDVELHFQVKDNNANKLVFGVGIFKMDGTRCYGTNTLIDKVNFSHKTSGKVVYQIESLNLVQGDYYFNVACHHEDGTPYDYITKALNFSVHSRENDVGIAYIPHKWLFLEEENL